MFNKREWIVRQIYRGEGQRFTQDTPVLLEVWVEYVRGGGRPIDLLLTPYQDPKSSETSAGRLGVELLRRLRLRQADPEPAGEGPRSPEPYRLAYHQSAVALTIGFHDLVQVVLPMSLWWADRILRRPRQGVVAASSEWLFDLRSAVWRPNELERITRALTETPDPNPQAPRAPGAAEPVGAVISPDVLWAFRAVGLTELICRDQFRPAEADQTAPARGTAMPDDEDLRLSAADAQQVVQAAAKLFSQVLPYWDRFEDGFRPPVLVYSISVNRKAKETVFVSSLTVKADAVTRLFGVDCSSLRWAVVDGGIDAHHKGFRKRHIVEGDSPAAGVPAAGPNGPAPAPRPREAIYETPFETDQATREPENYTRVVATYDFTAVRQLLQPNLFENPANLATLPVWLQDRIRELEGSPLAEELEVFKNSLKRGRMLDWGLLGDLVRVRHDSRYVPPVRAHGTHVAGVLAADWRVEDGCPVPGGLQGLCPTISLYDLRVIDKDGNSDEFLVMAALQFVRSLNQQSEIMAVHGVNLSLSIPHDVRNFACGRTPICDEAERLVGAGIVVVAAAGNQGFRQAEAGAGPSLLDAYQSITISDPGNAEAVITVGSTHRDRPHQYGVSYFSSRGPTGDGREKPDLVAPGEKIQSTVPNNGLGTMDGTSQAAPHVSGAAAILMARHSELIGRPAEIKRVLCRTATDLGRWRHFQGSGLIDVLRALQSV
jgi:serine protease AprX